MGARPGGRAPIAAGRDPGTLGPGGAAMTRSIPEGFGTVTPYLVVKGVAEVLTFLEKAFDAQVEDRMDEPGGTVAHAVVRIGDSMVMLGEAPSAEAELPAMLYLYVEDVDRVYQRALDAGGESISELADQFYGDRNAAVKDAAGNQWWIATHKESLTHEELQRRAAAREK